jgi:hypothetical protein
MTTNDPLEAMQLIELHRRSTRLLNSLHSRRKSERNRDAAVRYNNLRKDVKRFANDSRFARLVPRAWYWTPIRDIPLAVAVLIVGEVVACFILDLDPGALFEGTLMASFAVGLLVVFGGVATGWLPGENWYIASTNQEIWDRANMLHEYVGDLASQNPNLSVRDADTDRTRMEFLESYTLELEDEIEDARQQVRSLREMVRGFETPSQFEVEDAVLDKLMPLERRRLLEAAQAYRVNAWTPAAAVCGMILEGRLQEMCRQNDIRLGGMSAMIVRLGEAGLLHGYYDKLAQIGEFFRHRATHPTSEEFDREKTTLILTSLIILIRDLF